MNINSQIITVNDINIEVVKKGIKNFHLAVYPPDGRVRIAVPLSTSDESVNLFALSKLSWIKRRQNEVLEQSRQTERLYVSGENHYFRGQRYILNVHYADIVPYIFLRNKKQMDMYVRPNSSYEKRKEVLTEWYRQELKIILAPLIEKWSERLAVTPHSVGVKQMKTRWGTCNHKSKSVWFNLELIKKPIHCIEYIVVHELTHLIEEKHNDNFRTLLDIHLPKWQQYRAELNEFVI